MQLIPHSETDVVTAFMDAVVGGDAAFARLSVSSAALEPQQLKDVLRLVIHRRRALTNAIERHKQQIHGERAGMPRLLSGGEVVCTYTHGREPWSGI